MVKEDSRIKEDFLYKKVKVTMISGKEVFCTIDGFVTTPPPPAHISEKLNSGYLPGYSYSGFITGTGCTIGFSAINTIELIDS